MAARYMSPKDVEFFRDRGWRHITDAEFRDGDRSVELMWRNEGRWTGMYRGWEGPQCETPIAAFVAAEVDGWGENDSPVEKGARARWYFKQTFTG